MFDYSEYENIVKRLHGWTSTFEEAATLDDFIVIRHDVEFSVERALAIARLDSKYNIRSTFLFQVYSNAYNLFSETNKRMVKQIQAMGHEVGLHLYVSHLQSGDLKGFERELDQQAELFTTGLGLPCNVFSTHRPPQWVMEDRRSFICDRINAYGDRWFEYSPNPTRVKYMADSMHRWKYGYPLNHLHYHKIQLVMHPDEWTPHGDEGGYDYFEDLMDEKGDVFIDTLCNETKHFEEAAEKRHGESYTISISA